MKKLGDNKLYTNYDKYYVTKKVLHNMIMAQSFEYYKVRFEVTKEGFYFSYKINDIKIEVVGKTDNDIAFFITYKDEKESFKFKGPSEVNDQVEYERAVFEYWDKMLYTIYLCATCSQFEVNNIDEIMSYFKMIYNASICGWR